MNNRHLTRSQLAKMSGVGVEALRFYEKRGLLLEPPRGDNGYRYYPPGDIKRLQFIQRAKELGFTLEEVSDLLSLHSCSADSGDVKALAEKKLSELDKKLADLQRMRLALADVTARCNGQGSTDDCPIIASLIGE